ncbi:hypothetical protein SAY87_013453 [Trapa incisa]|uniref:Rhodanese domain-containing protein n=1 Tax=Trapa incisa TaxID=236973 RepID=A0AAN7QG36_9MYRT|nr:hypothetical protein SAY87_013453 [Trapa incisa]
MSRLTPRHCTGREKNGIELPRVYESPKGTALKSNAEAAAMAYGVPLLYLSVWPMNSSACHRYLDVRTPEEFRARHAPGAVNVPYIYQVGSDWRKNSRFLEEVSAHFRKDDEIIVGCQSGLRSEMAAKYLPSAGFYGVIDMAGGYSAWTRSGLPTD